MHLIEKIRNINKNNMDINLKRILLYAYATTVLLSFWVLVISFMNPDRILYIFLIPAKNIFKLVIVIFTLFFIYYILKNLDEMWPIKKWYNLGFLIFIPIFYFFFTSSTSQYFVSTDSENNFYVRQTNFFLHSTYEVFEEDSMFSAVSLGVYYKDAGGECENYSLNQETLELTACGSQHEPYSIH